MSFLRPRNISIPAPPPPPPPPAPAAAPRIASPFGSQAEGELDADGRTKNRRRGLEALRITRPNSGLNIPGG